MPDFAYSVKLLDRTAQPTSIWRKYLILIIGIDMQPAIPAPEIETYRAGDFVLTCEKDSTNLRITFAGRPVTLQPFPLHILALLIRSPDGYAIDALYDAAREAAARDGGLKSKRSKSPKNSIINYLSLIRFELGSGVIQKKDEKYRIAEDFKAKISSMTIGDITLFFDRNGTAASAMRNGMGVNLTASQLNLLSAAMKNPGRVITSSKKDLRPYAEGLLAAIGGDRLEITANGCRFLLMPTEDPHRSRKLSYQSLQPPGGPAVT